MSSAGKRLQGRIAVIGVDENPLCADIVAHLLLEGAAVVAIAQSSFHLQSLRTHLLHAPTDKLITLLTDFPDYDKAISLADTIREKYGPPDIVVLPLSHRADNIRLSDLSIVQWEHALSESLTVYFICSRIAIPAMVKRGQGLFVAISNTEWPGLIPNDPLTNILMAAQIHMAWALADEVRDAGVNAYLLFATGMARSIGQRILGLYTEKVRQPAHPVIFLTTNKNQ